MKPQEVIELLTEEKNESNLCVILRSGPDGLETLLVADELGRWSISGGHAKENETNAQAAQREVKEETGLDVEPQPILWAYHAARDKPTVLFYAVTDQEEVRPGGGDVTDCRWVKLDQLGDLNGTDRLAIHLAANRVHNPESVVNDAVEVAEDQGYAVATVAAPPWPRAGIYLRVNGKGSETFAKRVSEWAESLKWPTSVIVTTPYASTTDALHRASRCRKLTPMLEAILHTADALWRYESAIAPALAQGRIVLEIGPEIDAQRLLDRGLSGDLWEDLEGRVPKPTAMFDVGEDFTLADFQVIKDSIEGMKNPDDVNPQAYLDKVAPGYVVRIPKARLWLKVSDEPPFYAWDRPELSEPAQFASEEAAQEIVDKHFGGKSKPDALEPIVIDLYYRKKDDDKRSTFDAQHEAEDTEPRRYLNQLTPRQMDVPWKMEFVRDDPEQWDNPIVRCPKCKHEGPLLQDFSYLRAGFNGIEAGEPDDLDAQECGRCGAKLEYDEIVQHISKHL